MITNSPTRLISIGIICLLVYSPLFAQQLTTPDGVMIEEVPDMPQSDINAVMNWIKVKVTGEKLPYCYKKSYGRTAGQIANTCPDGTEKNGELCYPKCKDDYKGVGPVCWHNCPSGYTNNGPTCFRGADTKAAGSRTADCPPGYTNTGLTCYRGPDTYSASSSVADCPSGYTNMGATCFRGVDSYGKGCTTVFKKFGCRSGYTDMGCFCSRGASSLGMESMTCPTDRFRKAARCYVRCRDGYTNNGEFCGRGANSLGMSSMVCPSNYFQGPDARCHQTCETGYTNTGETCYRGPSTTANSSYGRGAGVVLTCPSGSIRDETGGPLGLCYPQCRSGFKGVGPVCWQQCSPGWSDCAAGCAKTSMECATTTIDQVVSTLTLVTNIATLGMSSTATAPLKAGEEAVKIGAKTLKGTTKVGVSLVKFAKKMKDLSNSPVVKKAVKIKKIIYNEKTKKIKKEIEMVKDVYDVASGVNELASDFYADFADDFETQTSAEVNNEINTRFGPKTARYLKKYWGNIQLQEMAGADGFQIAQDVLSLASIADPTGVVGVVSAFTKPICLEEKPFPTLSQSYK